MRTRLPRALSRTTCRRLAGAAAGRIALAVACAVVAGATLSLTACSAPEATEEAATPEAAVEGLAPAAPDATQPVTAGRAADVPPPSPDRYRIPLSTGAVAPKALAAADIAQAIESRLAAVGGGRAHMIVQLAAPPEAADIASLAERGITLLDPLTRVTWTAAVTKSAASALDGEPSLRWAGELAAADKLAAGARPGDEPPDYMKQPDGKLAYAVRFHKDVTAAEVEALARDLGVTVAGLDAATFGNVRTVAVVASPDQLTAVAEADIVQWIEPAPPPVKDLNVGGAQPLSNVGAVQAAPFNLDGTGVNVGIWEAGPAVVDNAHLDLTGRVNIQPGQSATRSDHAAHVAGTIGGSGANVAAAEGMAPNVTMASWSVETSAANPLEDVNEMTAATTGTGGGLPVQVTNHSYGAIIGWDFGFTPPFSPNQGLFGAYTNRSAAFDNLVVQSGLVIVKSAGNDRNDAPPAPVTGQPADCTQNGFAVFADCIDPFGSAKNVVTVGAMNGANAIAGFSSFGPTDDGRIKPDVVAHGVSLLSLASSNFFSDSPNDNDNNDDVVDSTTASVTMSGTSMSAPVVSGIAALLLQDAAANGNVLTAEGVRALLLGTARDVAGVGQATVGPDYATGWGIADAQAAATLRRQGGLAQATLTGTGAANAWRQSVFVPAGLAELKVTLAWNDPAGAVCPVGTTGCLILVNDLDLRLIAPDGTTFRPWTLNAANPGQAAVRNGGNDAVNTVEQVSVLNPPCGAWTAVVSANAGNLPFAPQAFAVASLAANAVPSVAVAASAVADEGAWVDVTATVTDADVADALWVTWDWGDGSTETVQLPETNAVAETVTTRHRWGDNGTFTVTATAHDELGGCEKGGRATDTLAIVVNNVAPSVDPPTVQPPQPWPGQAVSAAAAFVDPGWLDDHTATVKWGDAPATATATAQKDHVAPEDVGAVEATKPNGYAVPGDYDVELCVTDDDGDIGCASVPLRVELSPDMPGVFTTANETTFLTWTGALPGIVAAAKAKWRNGTGVAMTKWIYEADDWLFFFQVTPNDVPNFDADQPPDFDDNRLAIAVRKADFQRWFWCGIQLSGGGVGCHPQYGPPPASDGVLHPWVAARIVESRPHIFAMLQAIFE